VAAQGLLLLVLLPLLVLVLLHVHGSLRPPLIRCENHRTTSRHREKPASTDMSFTNWALEKLKGGPSVTFCGLPDRGASSRNLAIDIYVVDFSVQKL
jgi:hypothetical protein